MDVATSFAPLLQVLASGMTRPTAANLHTLVVGWLFAPQRTILGMLRAAGVDRHHAAFHRVFASARWCVDRAGLALFDLFTRTMRTVFLAVDDTLLPRFGKRVFGVGMHRDAVLSSRGHAVVRWGHCWVVLCVVVESCWVPGRRFSLPVLARLYLNRDSARRWRRAYRSRNELMLEMLGLLDRHVGSDPDRLHLLGDSGFTAPAILARMPASVTVTGRVVANVRIHEPPPPRRPGQVGRPRIRGDRLPTPEEMLAEKGLARMRLKLYEGSEYHVRVATAVGRFHKCPDRDVRVVAVEHLRGGRGVEVFYTTDVEADVATILQRYSWRWTIEIVFRDAKNHLGIGEPRNRTREAARRTATVGWLLYGLVVWWHETARDAPAPAVREWRGKRGPSFADMLAALRGETLREARDRSISTPEIPTALRKLLDQLTRLLSLAA